MHPKGDLKIGVGMLFLYAVGLNLPTTCETKEETPKLRNEFVACRIGDRDAVAYLKKEGEDNSSCAFGFIVGSLVGATDLIALLPFFAFTDSPFPFEEIGTSPVLDAAEMGVFAAFYHGSFASLAFLSPFLVNGAYPKEDDVLKDPDLQVAYSRCYWKRVERERRKNFVKGLLMGCASSSIPLLIIGLGVRELLPYPE